MPNFSAGMAVYGGLSALVVLILGALVGRHLGPEWMRSRTKFETEIVGKLERALDRQGAENQRLQERIDGGLVALRADVNAKDTTLRALWHDEANAFNKAVGSVAGRTEENARNIEALQEQFDASDRKADVRHESTIETLHALDKTVDRLAVHVEALVKKGS